MGTKIVEKDQVGNRLKSYYCSFMQYTLRNTPRWVRETRQTGERRGREAKGPSRKHHDTTKTKSETRETTRNRGNGGQSGITVALEMVAARGARILGASVAGISAMAGSSPFTFLVPPFPPPPFAPSTLSVQAVSLSLRAGASPLSVRLLSA